MDMWGKHKAHSICRFYLLLNSATQIFSVSAYVALISRSKLSYINDHQLLRWAPNHVATVTVNHRGHMIVDHSFPHDI